MENNILSVVKPDVLTQNMLTINAFIKESYSKTKLQVQDGMNFIKDEFSGLYDKTATYINRMVLPVNNFLKDFTQIDSEFQQALDAEPLPPGVTPLAVAVATGPMEENY